MLLLRTQLSHEDLSLPAASSIFSLALGLSDNYICTVKYGNILCNFLCREQWKIIYSLTFKKKDNLAIMTTGILRMYSVRSNMMSM